MRQGDVQIETFTTHKSSIRVAKLYLDRIGSDTPIDFLNNFVEASKMSFIFVADSCSESESKFLHDAVCSLESSKELHLIYRRSTPSSIIFSKEAWIAVGGFEAGSKTSEILKRFCVKAKLARSFSMMEVSGPKESLPSEKRVDYTSPSQKRVLFFVPYGAWQNHNIYDAVLASALKLRGAEICAVTCDGLFQDSCYVLIHSGNPSHDCQLCRHKGKSLFDAFQLPLTQLRDYISADEIASINKYLDGLEVESFREVVYQDLPVGEWVTPIICSYFRVPPQHLSLPQVKNVHKKYVSYALTTYKALSRVFDNFQPTNVVMLNGNGFLHPAALALSKNREVPVLTHEAGYHHGSFIMVENDVTAAIAPQIEIIKRWKDVPLTKEQLDVVKQHFIEREQGIGLNRTPFYNFSDSHNKVREKLRIPHDARIVSVFTSSEYELVYSRAFDNAPKQFDVIDKLITIFANRPEYLVIRHHPAIGGISGGTSGPPDYSLIERAYSQARNAPSNVRVIMPDERLTSYSLLWNSDAAITFYSTVGPEAVARGLPAAGFYFTPTGSTVTHEITDSSLEGIEKLVDELLEHKARFGVEDLRRLYRSMYAFFFRYCDEFRSFTGIGSGEFQLNVSSFEDLKEGRDAALDRVCDFILKGGDIIKRPSEADFTISTEAEDLFLEEELRTIKEYRAKLDLSLSSSVTHSTEPTSTDTSVLNLIVDNLISVSSNPSAWRKHIRGAAVDFLDINLGSNNDEMITLLCEKLSQSTDRFITITHECFQYDESFFTSSIELMNENPAAHGVLWGGWTSSFEVKTVDTTSPAIQGTIFTKRTPTDSYSHAKSILPLLKDPLLLFAFSFTDRIELLNFLQALPRKISTEVLGTQIYSFINSNEFVKTGNPMVIVSPWKSIDHRVFDFTTGHSTFSCRANELKIINSDYAFKDSPDFPKYIQHAVDLMNSNRDQEALEILVRATGVVLDSPDLFFAQAIAQARLGRRADAVRSLIALFERDPGHKGGRSLYAELTADRNS